MLQRIDQSASTKCPSCDCAIEKPDHLFCCPMADWQLITSECISNVTAVCEKWKFPGNVTKAIKESIQFWITHRNYSPPYMHIANQELQDALKVQAHIGWNNFLKGFIATKFQAIANRTRKDPLNAFEQIRWTCEIIKPIWAGKLEDWTHRNKDCHGHTPELFLLKREIDPQYRTKIFPSWRRITTTAQSVHYLLNVNNQADYDPLPERSPPSLSTTPRRSGPI
jgi:hypothetical protein